MTNRRTDNKSFSVTQPIRFFLLILLAASAFAQSVDRAEVTRKVTEALKETSEEKDAGERLAKIIDRLNGGGARPAVKGLLDEFQYLNDPLYQKNAFHILGSAYRPFVIGGEPCQPKEFEDCVVIQGANGTWCCTGTLVSPDVVVTAGHCKCGARVGFGSDANRIAKSFAVRTNVVHGDYNGTRYRHDLRLLILEEPVSVVWRKIAKTEQINGATSLLIVGFGHQNPEGNKGAGPKNKVDVPMTSPRCAKPIDPTKYGCHRDEEAVGSDPFFKKDSCVNDSGGPAYVRIGEDFLVAGATSRKIRGSKTCGEGGIYVRLDGEHKTWMGETAKKHKAQWLQDP